MGGVTKRSKQMERGVIEENRTGGEKFPRGNALPSPVNFRDIEAAIRESDPGKASAVMATFLEQRGGVELARRLLLLGSGYLSNPSFDMNRLFKVSGMLISKGNLTRSSMLINVMKM